MTHVHVVIAIEHDTSRIGVTGFTLSEPAILNHLIVKPSKNRLA